MWNKSANNKPLDPDMQSGSQVKQVLPDKFNTATTLTADIKPGDNTADFALTSK